jgi:hypothetical protein
MTIEMNLRTALAAAVALAALLTSHAAAQPAVASAAASAPARTYAIVCLIGDEFSVVSRRPDVGTNLNPKERTVLPVSDAVLGAHPGMPVMRATIRDPRLFALQEKLWTESADSHDMQIALVTALATDKGGGEHAWAALTSKEKVDASTRSSASRPTPACRA